ncbi:MAG: APC family permease [Nocardioidaceae bacterium]|nr:MAG: APC family permease [Nocardioidaceae bacterium]
MTLSAPNSPQGTQDPGSHGRLRPNAIGLVGVVFMVVAFSAPISAMTANVPVAVGYGNGIGAPAGFIVATIVLTIFSIGFVALAKHITAAGAFYTFISQGWSKVMGLPAGIMSMFVYMTMEAGLVGLFAALSDQAFNSTFDINMPWQVYAAIGLIVMAVLSHFDISVAAKVLGVVLVTEILLLASFAFSVLFHGGGDDGIIWRSINPAAAFSTNGIAGGVAGLGLLFAFWSWVGFEATAIFGEESRDPKRIVPQATLIAVIGIGVFYTFISWMIVSGTGREGSVELATSADPFELILSPTREFLGGWAVTAFQWVAILGSFACALAIHNSASRYLFAFGRDRILPHGLGAVHPDHGSPWVASLTQSIFAAVLVVITSIAGADPYAVLFGLVAIMATLSLLFVQVLCSISVIVYFHVKGEHPETASWWRTLLSPIIGGAGMAFVIYLLVSNMTAAAGAASETLLFKLIPYIVTLLFVIPFLTALYWRAKRPDKYETIGSSVFEELK